jgi:hypothetical protein
MDEPVPPSPDTLSRSLRIYRIAAYLRQRPQELIDAKRLLRRFRVSAEELYQALR